MSGISTTDVGVNVDDHVIDGIKLSNVCLSCKTKDHLKTAWRYYLLFKKKYEIHSKWQSSDIYYYQGKAMGIIESKIIELEL